MGSVGSVKFQIVPCSSLDFSRSVGPFQCSRCSLQGFNLWHLSLPEQLPSVYFGFSCLHVSSVSNFCPDKGGKGGHLLRLTCSVVLWGGRR